MVNWTQELENKLVGLVEDSNLTYKEVAKRMNTTTASVKHKYQRIRKKRNEKRYHHPVKKIKQVHSILKDQPIDRILETNAGYGNLTKIYAGYGGVISLEIKQDKVTAIQNLGLPGVEVEKADSFIRAHDFIAKKKYFDVIDLDPYGFPSRFLPTVLRLLKRGFLFMTFPKMGASQINKITQEHYRVFWDIQLEDKDNYEKKIHKKMKDYGLQWRRRVEYIDTLELSSVYRFCYSVEKESMLKLVNLKVKGKNE